MAEVCKEESLGRLMIWNEMKKGAREITVREEAAARDGLLLKRTLDYEEIHRQGIARLESAEYLRTLREEAAARRILLKQTLDHEQNKRRQDLLYRENAEFLCIAQLYTYTIGNAVLTRYGLIACHNYGSHNGKRAVPVGYYGAGIVAVQEFSLTKALNAGVVSRYNDGGCFAVIGQNNHLRGRFGRPWFTAGGSIFTPLDFAAELPDGFEGVVACHEGDYTTRDGNAIFYDANVFEYADGGYDHITYNNAGTNFDKDKSHAMPWVLLRVRGTRSGVPGIRSHYIFVTTAHCPGKTGCSPAFRDAQIKLVASAAWDRVCALEKRFTTTVPCVLLMDGNFNSAGVYKACGDGYDDGAFVKGFEACKQMEQYENRTNNKGVHRDWVSVTLMNRTSTDTFEAVKASGW
jgi:hypothetical protein